MKQKIEHTFHFISGLPRSGSTLLANVLAQNSRFHTTQTSGIADVMFLVRNNWDKMVEWQAHPDEEGKIRVLRGILESYYKNVSAPVIFDKSRVWVSLLEMAETVLGYKPKVIVPVRDIRDILASMEKLWRKKASTGQTPHEQANYLQFQSVEGRLKAWINDMPVGVAYNRVKDAVVRGHRDQMYFLEFEKFTADPEEELKKVYAFLGEKWFVHDFKNVEQVTQENDDMHGFKDLHKIRPIIESMGPQWPEVLGHAADEYAHLNFWERL